MSFADIRFSRLRRRLRKRYRELGILLTGLGLLMILLPAFQAQISDIHAEAISGDETSTPITIDDAFFSDREYNETPSKIVIPSVNIDLSITDAYITEGQWEVSEHSASFGIGSALPGEGGNTVVFAHAREGLFLPLQQIEPNSTIYLFTNSTWHEYSVSEIKTVSPNDIEVIAPTDTEQLTLFTCSGFFDEKRLIIVAKTV